MASVFWDRGFRGPVLNTARYRTAAQLGLRGSLFFGLVIGTLRGGKGEGVRGLCFLK